MQNNILFSLVLAVFMSGLYGCSCSQASKSSHELAPGLYLSELTINEDEASAFLNVTLQREVSEDVSVTYTISAIDPEGRTAEEIADFAIVGPVGTPEVDVIAQTGQITFSASGSDISQLEIPLIADTIYEHDEKFLVTLTAATAGVAIVKGSVEVVIKNDDAIPVASFVTSSSAVSEISNTDRAGDNSLGNAQITISLNTASRVDSIVSINEDFVSSIGANYRVDYVLFQGETLVNKNTSLVIPAGELELVLALDIVDDGVAEPEESFQLILQAVKDVAIDSNLSLSKIAFQITDNDTLASGVVKKSTLNDTGILESIYNYNAALLPETDANVGKDSVDYNVTTKTGAGRAGFDFTKLDSTGQPTTAEVSYPTVDGEVIKVIPWDCVRDNVTGLVWEVKTYGGFRGDVQNYYWYDPNFSTNGGNAGEKGSSVCSANPLEESCNTAFYAADVNHMKLCGMTGWRLPTIEELRSINDYGVYSGTADGESDVSYDRAYFAGDVLAVDFYWSSTTDAGTASRARTFRYRTPGFEESRYKNDVQFGAIRLVNDSLLTTSAPQ
ncbi:MAG: DUF1566 domain-containing protein [Gammaproteobacteria bacterium]|nr:DUF1566 domain-containing protein [Gammaproteobacteria bacterium]